VQYYSVKVELLPVHDNVNALCISRWIGQLEWQKVFDIFQRNVPRNL